MALGLPLALAFGTLLAVGAAAKLNRKMRHHARLRMSAGGFRLERAGLFRAFPPVEGTLAMFLEVDTSPKGLEIVMPAGRYTVDAVLSEAQVEWLRQTMEGYARRYEGQRLLAEDVDR